MERSFVLCIISVNYLMIDFCRQCRKEMSLALNLSLVKIEYFIPDSKELYAPAAACNTVIIDHAPHLHMQFAIE